MWDQSTLFAQEKHSFPCWLSFKESSLMGLRIWRKDVIMNNISQNFPAENTAFYIAASYVTKWNRGRSTKVLEPLQNFLISWGMWGRRKGRKPSRFQGASKDDPLVQVPGLLMAWLDWRIQPSEDCSSSFRCLLILRGFSMFFPPFFS